MNDEIESSSLQAEESSNRKPSDFIVVLSQIGRVEFGTVRSVRRWPKGRNDSCLWHPKRRISDVETLEKQPEARGDFEKATRNYTEDFDYVIMRIELRDRTGN
jgi:hypothetical protein